ncbi:MAG: hypothetical protein E6J64_17405 [Deltaproteobacteria bacterium]|nr:MAG: hypothetical protein E6J64_17405 [Deltaproteobacteria bacterium]
MEGAWTRRPATAVSRLSGRPLLLLSARDLPAARDAALVASHVCQLELGLEIVPLGGSSEIAAELVRQLKSRGAPPSALRLAEPDPAKTAPAVLQRIATLAQKE